MQKLWFRICSLLLVIVMTVNMLPLGVLAEEYQEAASEAGLVTKTFEDADGNTFTEKVLPDATIVEEVTEGRTEYSKQFRLDNGLFVSAVYSDPVHYEKDGQWVDIDNTLKAKLDGSYQNTAGVWDVSLPNNLGNGGAVSITKDGYTLDFSMAGELRNQGNLEIMSAEEPVAEITTEVVETIPETAIAEEIPDATEAEQLPLEASLETTEIAVEEITPEIIPSETISAELIPIETEPVVETIPAEETVTMAIGGANETFAVRAAQSSFAQVQKVDLTEAKEAAEYPELVIEKNYSQLLYNDVYTGTDIQYDLQTSRVKESIIMESYDSNLRGYRYALNTGSMIPEIQEDGSIYFYDETEEEIVMVMPAPYLVDAAGAYNHDIRVSLTGQNGSYTLIYLLPQSWLATTDRTWPVVLDPVVKPSITISNITDHTVAQDNDTIPKNNDELTCGRSSSRGLMRIFLKFEELPEITSSQVIVEAKIKLYKGGTGETSSAMEVHKVEENWNINTLSWANQPNHTTSVEDVNMVCESGRYTWCVTDIVRNWYTTENTGMMFKLRDSEETSGYNNYRDFRSSDYSENNNYQPNLTITFFDSNGLEDKKDYVSASAGRAGTGHVNTYSGNLTWVRDDIGFGGNRMPVSISHVYNLNDADSNDFGVGYGWRTNYHQRVDDYNSSYYVWEDGDGTEHYFEKLNSTTFIAEDDSGLILSTSANFDKITGEDYVITDIYGNASYFDTNKRLMCMVNNQKTKSYILITYIGDTNKIDTITDGIGRKYQFTYANDLLSRITCKTAAGTEITYVDFSYSQNYGTTSVENENTYTTSITDRDGKTATYTYKVYITEEPQEDNTTIKYYNYVLTSAQDIDGYKLQYNYQETNEDYPTHRVKTIEESDGDTLGGKLTLTYEHNQTIMEDIDGNKQILQYNDYGNVVSIQDGQGRAQYAQYAANRTTDTGKANQLTFSSKLQYTVSNLLNDSSFESGTSGWTGGTTNNQAAYYGSKSLEVTGSATKTVEDLASGSTYTFSAYVKTGANASAKLFINNGTKSFYSDSLSSENDWTRLEVSYTTTAEEDITVGIQTTGTAYLDCVQLELAPTASRYNLVENGDFRYGNSFWTNVADDEDALYTFITPENDKYGENPLISDVAPQMDNNCVYTVGDPENKHRLKQTINVSGEEGDTFVFGAWAQADSAPLFDGAGNAGTRYFCVAATFNYTDGKTKQFVAEFNPGNETQWQYVSGEMVAQKDYDSIIIQVSYNYNANDAKFDGIQLFKEEFGSSYTYDDDGNITSITDILGNKTKRTYNSDQELTKEELPSGLVYHHSYDTYHNLTKTITAKGSTKVQTKTFTYDDYGNLTLEKTKEYEVDAPITTVSYTYSTDFNRPVSITDTTGKTTYYEYDPNTNVLLSVQYPEDTVDDESTENINEDTTTHYTYDNMFRQTGVTAKTDTGLNLSVAYTFSGEDYLTKIQTPTTAYSFTYGDFGLRESVKAGNHTLTTYDYSDDRNFYLETLDFGNGDSIDYTYDDLGRILSQTYEDNSSVTYTYNNSGALAKVYDSATKTTTTYYYDFLDRTMKYVESSADLTHSVGYEYDELNRMSALVETINGTEHKTEYTYDEHSRVKTVTDGTVTKANTYDVFERLSQQTTSYPTQTEVDGVVQESTFTVKTDSFTFTSPEQDYTSGQIASHVIDAASYDVTYTYTYDDNGNILSISDGTNTTSYVYDSANQLVRENNQADNFTHTWTYDNAGNILNRKEYAYTTGALGTVIDTIDYTYGDASWGDLLTIYDGNTITYDALGNPLSDGTWTYTWQHGRQLASMSDGTTELAFTYNKDDIRTQKINGNLVYDYVYNGGSLSQMTISEKIGDTPTVTDTLYFGYDAAGQPVTVNYNGIVYYYVTNIQGDVIGILNSEGTQVVSYVYDAWGNLLSTTGTMATTLGVDNPLRYRGYVYDNESQLYYLQSRYYDPEIGRFINADILISTGQGLLGNNMFAYCANNAVCHKDEHGTRYCAATTVQEETAEERSQACQHQNKIARSKKTKSKGVTFTKGKYFSINFWILNITAAFDIAIDTQGNIQPLFSIIKDINATGKLSASAGNTTGVYFVPNTTYLYKDGCNTYNLGGSYSIPIPETPVAISRSGSIVFNTDGDIGIVTASGASTLSASGGEWHPGIIDTYPLLPQINIPDVVEALF